MFNLFKAVKRIARIEENTSNLSDRLRLEKNSVEIKSLKEDVETLKELLKFKRNEEWKLSFDWGLISPIALNYAASPVDKPIECKPSIDLGKGVIRQKVSHDQKTEVVENVVGAKKGRTER